MFIVIRISGQVGLSGEIKESLLRLRLKTKYSSTLLEETSQNEKLLRKIRDFVAFGKIDRETLKELIEKRAKPLKKGNKIEADRIVSTLESKSLAETGIRSVFKLHPPRKGIDSKKHFGVAKGVLGNNKEKINDLVRRML